jgi:hypothetical protein
VQKKSRIPNLCRSKLTLCFCYVPFPWQNIHQDAMLVFGVLWRMRFHVAQKGPQPGPNPEVAKEKQIPHPEANPRVFGFHFVCFCFGLRPGSFQSTFLFVCFPKIYLDASLAFGVMWCMRDRLDPYMPKWCICNLRSCRCHVLTFAGRCYVCLWGPLVRETPW